MVRARVLGLGLLVSCGPDVIERAELDGVCGEDGPVRLLELSSEPALFGASESDRVADRRILAVGYLGEPVEGGFGLPTLERTEAWSVGLCGESPLLLETEMAFRYDEAWPDVLLGCSSNTGDIVTLDPLGMRAPHVVMRAPECSGMQTPHGLVIFEEHDADTGALVLLPWVDDPWTETAERRVLADPVRTHATPSHGPSNAEVIAIRDDVVFAITLADELISVSLVDQTRTIEATHVRELDASLDGRWLLWQDLEPTSDDEASPPGAIYLKDRATGTTKYLLDAPLAASFWTPLEFIDRGIVRLQTGYIDSAPERIFFLPEMATVDLPLGSSVRHGLPDGRWLVGTLFGGPYALFDAGFVESRSLFDGEGWVQYVGDDGIDVFAVDGLGTDPATFFELEAPIWFVPWDGERELLAARALQAYRRLRDGRIITTVDVDTETLSGSLIVAAPRVEDEQRIDDHVLNWASVNEDDEAIVYGVADGERTGVWLTKLADDGR